MKPTRCTYCGGSLPVTERADRTGECACGKRAARVLDALDNLNHASKRDALEKRAEIERKSRNSI